MVSLVFFTFCNFHTLYFQILKNWPTLLYSCAYEIIVSFQVILLIDHSIAAANIFMNIYIVSFLPSFVSFLNVRGICDEFFKQCTYLPSPPPPFLLFHPPLPPLTPSRISFSYFCITYSPPPSHFHSPCCLLPPPCCLLAVFLLPPCHPLASSLPPPCTLLDATLLPPCCSLSASSPPSLQLTTISNMYITYIHLLSTTNLPTLPQQICLSYCPQQGGQNIIFLPGPDPEDLWFWPGPEYCHQHVCRPGDPQLHCPRSATGEEEVKVSQQSLHPIG